MFCLVKHLSLAIQRSGGKEDEPGDARRPRVRERAGGRGEGALAGEMPGGPKRRQGRSFRLRARSSLPAERVLLSSPADPAGGAPGSVLPVRGGGEGAARSSRSAGGCCCCRPTGQPQAAQSHRRLPILRPSRREGTRDGLPGRGRARVLGGERLQPRKLLLLPCPACPAAAGDTAVPAAATPHSHRGL